MTLRHLEIFVRIEEFLEDVALACWITDAQKEPALGPEAAQEYYNSLDKASGSTQCGVCSEGSGDKI